MTQSETILVLGIGNLLWADEGFGVRAVEEFGRRYVCDQRVQLLEGGTQGLYLLPYVQQAEALLVFDAIDYGLTPGTLKVVLDDEVPAYMGAKQMSLHQTGFQDVLAAARLTGQGPTRLALVGVQPLELKDFGGSLREPVRSQLQPAIETAAALLRQWGVQVDERTRTTAASLNAAALALEAYEQDRPSPQDACRIGDARFLPGGRR